MAIMLLVKNMKAPVTLRATKTVWFSGDNRLNISDIQLTKPDKSNRKKSCSIIAHGHAAADVEGSAAHQWQDSLGSPCIQLGSRSHPNYLSELFY